MLTFYVRDETCDSRSIDATGETTRVDTCTVRHQRSGPDKHVDILPEKYNINFINAKLRMQNRRDFRDVLASPRSLQYS